MHKKHRVTPLGVLSTRLELEIAKGLLDDLELVARRQFPEGKHFAMLFDGQGGEFVAIEKGEEKKHAKKS